MIPYSMPRSIMLPLLWSGESSSTSAKERAENLSSGLGERVVIRSCKRGVIVLQGVHADVVKRARSRVLFAEQTRR